MKNAFPFATKHGFARLAPVGLAAIALTFCTGPSSVQAQDAVASSALQRSSALSQASSGGNYQRSGGLTLPNDASEADRQADADLGEQWVLKNSARPRLFSFFTDLSGFYTSNVALSHGREFGDSFLVATVGGSYSRPLAGPLTLNLNLSETFFRYNRFSEFDFDSFNAAVGLSMPWPRLWDSNLSLQYSFNTLTQDFTFDQIFSGHTLALAATKAVRLSTADNLSFGVAGAFNLAEPSSLQRADASSFVGYDLALSRSVTVFANYRVSLFVYPESGRRDFNQALSGGLRFQLHRWFSLSATVSGVLNDSNRTSFDYHAGNFGGGLNATLRF